VFWLLAPTLTALLVALACGGSARGLVSSGLKAWPLIPAAFAIELVLYNPPINSQPWAMVVGPWLWLLAQLVFFGVLVANARLAWPWRIAAFGVGLNTLVIALNGGHMPQSPEAALAVWGASHIDPSRLQNVAAIGVGTRLAWLADVIPEPGWLPRRNVVSVGDLLLALGVASWAFSAAMNHSGLTEPRRITMAARIGTWIDGAARPRQRSDS